MTSTADPICALATANGVGAISVIRVSGTGSKALVSKNFSKELTNKPSLTIHFGVFSVINLELINYTYF